MTLLKAIKLHQYEKYNEAYIAECKKYALNTDCESRLLIMDTKITKQPTSHDNEQEEKSTKSFTNILSQMTVHHFGSDEHKGLKRFNPTMDQLKAFIQLRHPIKKFAKLRPIYKTVSKKTKPELVTLCFHCKDLPVLPQTYQYREKPK